MKICVVSTSDDRLGGYLAGWRLANSLRGLGHDSQMLVANKKTDSSWVVEHGKLGFWINRFIRKAGGGLNFLQKDPEYYFDFFGARIGVRSFSWKSAFPLGVDAFVVTWTRDFLSVSQLNKMGRYTGVPIIWYLMDMSPLTGGCHYTWDCDGYISECGRCPALTSDRDHGWAWHTLKEKYQAIRSMNITIVAPTQRLAEQARKSLLFKDKRVEIIPLSVDPIVFSPGSKNKARSLFGLPENCKIIFFGANYAKERRKGWAYMVDALRVLKNAEMDKAHEILIVTAGASDVTDQIKDIFESKHIGMLRDDNALAAAYQAADLFVCPSIEDAGPMMINEAVMCGTPVVSFDVGVAFDLVHNGITGYRAENKNSVDLAKGMSLILNMSKDERQKVSSNCRNLAMDLCHPSKQAERFVTLVGSLMNGDGRPS